MRPKIKMKLCNHTWAYSELVRKSLRKEDSVLIFDQFENVGKASTDFFLNFVKLINPKERFDIIVSFRIDDTIWNDPTIRRVYEEIEQKMINELGAKKIAIEGLSAEDIGRWIRLVRDVSLPLIPGLSNN